MSPQEKRVQGEVVDPVCGMTVNPAKAAGSIEHNGTTYYFCSRSCADKFRLDPKKYVHTKSAPSVPPTGNKAIEYTCPMHPQVRQLGPGNCPICGMALEPVNAVDEGYENPELKDMTRRFWASVALTAPLLALMVSDLLPGQPGPAPSAHPRRSGVMVRICPRDSGRSLGRATVL